MPIRNCEGPENLSGPSALARLDVFEFADVVDRVLLRECRLESFYDLPWLVSVVVTRADTHCEGHHNVWMYISAHNPLFGFVVAGENECAGASPAQRF